MKLGTTLMVLSQKLPKSWQGYDTTGRGFGYVLDMSTAYHPEMTDKVRGLSQNSRGYDSACIIDTLEMVGENLPLVEPLSVAYKLELPQELSRVHNTFHVSNLKKCYSDDPLVVPLGGLQVDENLHFVEEPVEIMDREVKQLRRSRVPIVKVRWNSRRGPEFTWEREDQFRKKYPHLFTKTAPSSSAV
ncbi:hypothetical protein Tco_0921124 [Tanacetum coccineum]